MNNPTRDILFRQIEEKKSLIPLDRRTAAFAVFVVIFLPTPLIIFIFFILQFARSSYESLRRGFRYLYRSSAAKLEITTMMIMMKNMPCISG